jgi:hypothetical protein
LVSAELFSAGEASWGGGVFAVEETPTEVRAQLDKKIIETITKVVRDNLDNLFMGISFEGRKNVRSNVFYLLLIFPKTDTDVLNW